MDGLRVRNGISKFSRIDEGAHGQFIFWTTLLKQTLGNIFIHKSLILQIECFSLTIAVNMSNVTGIVAVAQSPNKFVSIKLVKCFKRVTGYLFYYFTESHFCFFNLLRCYKKYHNIYYWRIYSFLFIIIILQ